MPLTIPTTELKTAVAGLARVVNNRANLPILACARLDANSKTIRLTGTDISQVAVYEVTVAEPVSAPVSVLIPLAELQAVLKTAQGPDIEIEPGKDAVTLTATVAGQSIGRRVETPDIADWPELVAPADTKAVEPGFLQSLQQVLKFASSDDSRLLLKAAYLDVSAKSGHKIVATDSRRLTVLPCGILPLAESVIVPSCRFLNWSRLAGETQIGTGKGVFTLRCGPWAYTTKVVEGQYPRWTQVVPAGGDRTLELSEEDAELLIRALPSLPNYEGSSDAVVLCLEPNGARIYSRQDAKAPESAIRLEKSTHTGRGLFAIGLNRLFFKDALVAGFRCWEMRDETSPLLGRLSKNDKTSTHVLMPIRTIDHEVQRAEAPVAAPVPVPVQTNPIQKETPMPSKNHEAVQPAAEPGTLDKILVAYEAAKSAVRQAQAALADVALCVRDAIREQKTQSREIADVRVALQKLQAIKV